MARPEARATPWSSWDEHADAYFNLFALDEPHKRARGVEGTPAPKKARRMKVPSRDVECM